MRTRVKVWFAAFAVGLLAMPVWAQESAPTLDEAITGYESATHQSFQGIPTDWTSRHVVFSKPIPGSDAEYKVQQDPRYWMQLIQRAQASSDGALADAKAEKKKQKKKKVKPVPIKKDWSMNLQGTASTALEGVFPAKYSFVTSGESCSDYVAFPTGHAPTGSVPSIVGFTALYTADGCTAPIPTVRFSFDTANADAGAIVTSPVLSLNGTQMAFAEGSHLVLIKLPTSGTSGTLSGPTVLTEQTTAANYAACTPGTTGCMFAFALTNPDTNSSPYYDSQTDTLYVGDNKGLLYRFTPVFNGTPAASTSPWPVPADAGDSLTGPVFDATSSNVYVGDSSGFINQVANSTGTVTRSGRLGAGSGTATVTADPGGSTTLTVGTVVYTFHSSSGSCSDSATTGCIIHGGTVTQDAENIEAAINDDATQCGFTNGGICFLVTAANPAASATNPGTAVTTIQNTSFANLPLATGTTITLSPATLGIAAGMVDAPIVDSVAETVYSFVARDATTTADAGVRLLPISGGTITSTSVGTMAIIGTSSQSTPIYSGTFDNKYFTAASGASPSGNLYVCGDPGGVPTLYGVAIASNALSTVTTGPPLGTVAGTTCSNVTEVCNPGTGTCANTLTGNAVDWIFLSEEASVNTTTASSCTASSANGCVMAFNVNSAISSGTKASSDATEPGGTSGIVIDNVIAVATGGSQVYFTPLANSTCTGNTSTGSTGSGPCATQAAQNGL
ncbi:hypothetical protein [Candidatus Binatus sp.]|uniref:hypothetical protein n=1 Tax=Candidatus Binatus sp. TaxID=2811406 RepID=UPI003CAC5482